MTERAGPITLIAGPTASGKSALALRLAERAGGVVVNADSMQVYRDLRVLTARPSAADHARVPHLLYGHVDGARPYSVGLWLADVERVLRDPELTSRPLVFVGGTGLYFEALLNGIAVIPPVPQPVRDHWRRRGAAEPAQLLHAELATRDPGVAARLRPSDRQRIIRALEVIEGTGRSLDDWHSRRSMPLVDATRSRRIAIDSDRTELRARITRRFARMIGGGAVDEVRALRDRKLDPALPVMKAIGVPPILRLIEGNLSSESALAEGVLDSQHYAKRQQTWLRNRAADWERQPFSGAEDAGERDWSLLLR